MIKNLAANCHLPDIPNDFESSQILVAQHIKEPVPRIISAEKPITLSTILETVAKSPEASTSTSDPKTTPVESDQTEKQKLPDKEQVNKDQTTEKEIVTTTPAKETVSTPPAPKRLKLQRRILVDGFQVEKQFRLPTQAVPYGLVYPARDNLPINNPFKDHIVAHEPYDNHWHRSLPTPFVRLGYFLETVPPTNLPYFRRIAPPQNQKLCNVISLILGDLKGVPTPSRQIHFEPCPRAKIQNTSFAREPLFIKQVTHETAHLKERYLC